MIKYAILGPIELYEGERLVRGGGPRQLALLAMLLVYANRAVSGDRLIDALWGQHDRAGALQSLRVAISRLRKTLHVDVAGAEGEPALRTMASGYLLAVRPGELDAEVFQAGLEDGRRALGEGDAERAALALREALALWRGPALAEVSYEDWAQAEIGRLEELRLGALQARVDADLLLGEHAAVIGELEGLVASHRTREHLAAQLMLALYRSGRQAEALDVYQRTRTYLASELGLEPGPALKALQRAIFEQAPSLDLQRPGVTAPAPHAGNSHGPFPLPPVVAAGVRDRFVGRVADLEALASVYSQTASGSSRLVLLCGQPGIGKTRLATEFALSAHEDGAIVLYGRCDEQALLAQQPFVEALRHYVGACPSQELAGRLQHVSGELRRVVPELADRVPDLPEPLAGDPEGARSRLFEAVSSLLCEAAHSTPVVLILDDLHWADQATLLLLKYLVRYPRQARLMILGTYRETELDVDHPLAATIAELGRERLFERRALAPLDASAVSELVGVHVGDNASPELRQSVYEETEGNAFFVVEVLRHLAESGAIATTGAPAESGIAAGRVSVPEGIKDVIVQRVARLGQETSRALVMASVLGRAFELDVLAHLSELDEDELVDALDSAVRARVIEEVAGAAGHHTFSHALIRNTLYGELTATRRALLHRRAGAALEHARGGEIESYLAQLAHHFAQAGSGGDLDKAIQYGTRAGEHAISQLAYEQAAAHFRQTVKLIDAADRPGLIRQRCDLVIAQGEAERQAGDPAYRQTLLDGARLAQVLHDPDRLARAALANNRGLYSSAEGVDRDRVSVLHAALDAYDSTDSPTRAALFALLALELVMDDDWRRREKLSDDAVAIARRVGDPHTLALVLTQHGVAQWRPKTLPQRQANLREACQLADQLNDPLLAGHAANLAAHAAMEAGDLEEADRQLARLNAAAAQLGQPSMRWYHIMARTKRCLISGPPEEAERLAFAAMKLGRNAGQPDSMLCFLDQLIVARFLHGSLDHADPHLPDLSQDSSLLMSPDITPGRSLRLLVDAAMSAVLCEVGRLDDARRHFELLMSSDLDELPHTTLAIPAHASIACARLGDKPSAKRLDAILQPHSHRLVATGTSWFGATNHYLGLLATTLERPDEAHARLAAAEQTYTSLGAKPWLARLHHDWTAVSEERRRHE
jgi:DNA-binding SARP family transcriptional activator